MSRLLHVLRFAVWMCCKLGMVLRVVFVYVWCTQSCSASRCLPWVAIGNLITSLTLDTRCICVHYCMNTGKKLSTVPTTIAIISAKSAEQSLLCSRFTNDVYFGLHGNKNHICICSRLVVVNLFDLEAMQDIFLNLISFYCGPASFLFQV